MSLLPLLHHVDLSSPPSANTIYQPRYFFPLPNVAPLPLASLSPSFPATMSSITDSQRLAAIFRELRRFGPGSGSSTNHINQYTTLARSIIQFLDQTSLLPRAARLDDQVAVIARLQDLAYHEPDSGGVPDIARWCVGQWLRLLQQHGENVGALRGLYRTTSSNMDRSLILGQVWGKLGCCVHSPHWQGYRSTKEALPVV